jgi:cytochrome P450
MAVAPCSESVDAVGRLIRARRADRDPPKGDLLDKLLNFVDSESGIAFSDEQLVAQLVTIIAAGNDTTSGHIGNLVHRMLTVPGLWERLRGDRALVPRAIEESLRLDPPQVMFPRRVMKDTVLAGIALRRDEVVIISMAAANRDERVYGENADAFDLDRAYPNPRHLAFGRGIHTCIGAYQARKIARVAVDALLDGVGEMRLDPDYEYEKVLFHHFRTPQRLPVTIPR